MSLETMTPDPVWDGDAHEDTVETLADLSSEATTIHVWGGDWCGDCRSELPELAAALEAAGLLAAVVEHPVDQQKEGELTDEYGVEYIPTVVVERDGEELARFVESEPVPAAVHLADQVADRVPDLA
jgi:thiol-disulfide isomerase/thioredoxin